MTSLFERVSEADRHAPAWVAGVGGYPDWTCFVSMFGCSFNPLAKWTWSHCVEGAGGRTILLSRFPQMP